MNIELSKKLFQQHLNTMLEDVNLMNKGIALVHQESDFVVISIPTPIGKKIYLKIENRNFDIDPLHLYFVNPETYTQLPPNVYPSGSGIAEGHDFLPNPIICISSTYSYHTHPGHRNTPFDLYRNNFQLNNLIMTIKKHIDSDWSIKQGSVF